MFREPDHITMRTKVEFHDSKFKFEIVAISFSNVSFPILTKAIKSGAKYTDRLHWIY